MPLPSAPCQPAWEASPEASVSTLEQPQPQPIAEGFPGKVAIVTGGATGLGRAHLPSSSRRLGCHVAFCFVNLPGRDVSEQALLTETAISAMGVRVHANRCDVRDPGAVDRFVAETRHGSAVSTS